MISQDWKFPEFRKCKLVFENIENFFIGLCGIPINNVKSVQTYLFKDNQNLESILICLYVLTSEFSAISHISFQYQ